MTAPKGTLAPSRDTPRSEDTIHAKGPMTGVRVVELGFWVAAPSGAGVLADWGADVIKVEPPQGDPLRAVVTGPPGRPDVNPPFELDNRGKRSIALDLRTDEGRAIAHELLADTDVFITNLRRQALRRMGLDYETLSSLYPSLIYASATGYGSAGPDAERAAYDVGAFWARAGIAGLLSSEAEPPPAQRGGMGDHWAGIALVAGIGAALVQRSRTGSGTLVSTSLLRVGAYTLGWDLNIALRGGQLEPRRRRTCPPNPLFNCYATSDDQWLWLLGLESDRHWSGVVNALGLTERQATAFPDAASRTARSAELVAILDVAFAARPLKDWAIVLDTHEVWWAPVQGIHELLADPQSEPGGLYVEVDSSDGPVRMLAGPIDFADPDGRPLGRTPDLGQHTTEILAELGYPEEHIAQLLASGIAR